jgi:hypothetical protein
MINLLCAGQLEGHGLCIRFCRWQPGRICVLRQGMLVWSPVIAVATYGPSVQDAAEH